MAGKHLLIDTNAVFDYTGDIEEGLVYRRNPRGSDYLDDLISNVFFQIPLASIARYSERENGIEPFEQREYLKFWTNVGMVGHDCHDHMRQVSGIPYFSHSLDALKSAARWGVSVFALDPIPVHDLGEEWTSNAPLYLGQKDINSPKKLKKYYEMNTAILLGVGFLGYQFVNDTFDNPERFYPHVNSLMRVFNNITRRLDEGYFSNLHDIFYANARNDLKELEAMVSQNKRSMIYHYLNEFFDFKDRKTLRHFIDNVFLYNPSPLEREKNRRRTIMADIADLDANLVDFEYLPMVKRANILMKAFAIINERRNLYKGKKTDEAKFGLNKIIQQTRDLEFELSKVGGKIDLTLEQINISEKGRLKVESELVEYKCSEFFDRMTTSEEDNSMFAGTLGRASRVISKLEDRIFEEDDPVAQYAFFRMMRAQIRAHHLDPERYIRGFSTRLQRQRLT